LAAIDKLTIADTAKPIDSIPIDSIPIDSGTPTQTRYG
jgi:hypothetical protein